MLWFIPLPADGRREQTTPIDCVRKYPKSLTNCVRAGGLRLPTQRCARVFRLRLMIRAEIPAPKIVTLAGSGAVTTFGLGPDGLQASMQPVPPVPEPWVHASGLESEQPELWLPPELHEPEPEVPLPLDV